MNTLTKFIEEKFVPPLTKFASLKYIQILQRTFVSTMSLLLIGSLFLLVAQFPIDAWKEFLGPDLTAQLSRASGIGTQMFSVYVAAATAYYAIKYYNDKFPDQKQLDPILVVLLTIGSYMLIQENPVVEGAAYLSLGFLGPKGVFSAILVSLGTVEIYRFIVKKNIVIKMPKEVPPMIMESFMALIPSAVVVLFWWIIRYILGLDILNIVLNAFKPLIVAGDSVFGVIINSFFNRALWFVGIHGGNVVGSVVDPVLKTMGATNLAAAQAGQALPHIATYAFMDQYVWVGLAPLSFALLTCKSKNLKAIGLLALPAALFNIGEPLNFGLPVVLNPLMMIPSIFSFVVVGILAFAGCAIGLLPVPYLELPFTIPAPIKAFLGTNGNFMAFAWVIVAWIIMFLFFYPFVKAMDKKEIRESEATE